MCDKCGGKLVQRKDDAPETVKARLEVYRQRDRLPLKRLLCPAGLLKLWKISPLWQRTSQAILTHLQGDERMITLKSP